MFENAWNWKHGKKVCSREITWKYVTKWTRPFVPLKRVRAMPPFSCRQISMIFFTRTFIFYWVNTTILLLCINRQLKCCNPAVVRLLTLPNIPAFWHQALAYTAAQIVTSPHLRFLARLTAARWPSSSLTIRPHLRATHCPVRAIVASQHRHPVHYLRRLFSPDFTECRISTKTPSTITASSTGTSRRPRVHPAPHHRLLVSALFTASLAPSTSTSYASLHQPR